MKGEYYILPLESSMASETSLVVMVQTTGKNFTFKKKSVSDHFKRKDFIYWMTYLTNILTI